MTITPDTKDWTWVLERPCPACGFDPAVVVPAAVGDRIRANVDAWRGLLADARAATRPQPDVWSAVEYACHVRDVFALFDRRLHLMLDEDDPRFANWDQDATAVEDRYDEQDATTVLPALEANGARIAASFDAVADGDWARTGTRSDGARFTVATFATYLLHDPEHHVVDVAAGYERLGATKEAM